MIASHKNIKRFSFLVLACVVFLTACGKSASTSSLPANSQPGSSERPVSLASPSQSNSTPTESVISSSSIDESIYPKALTYYENIEDIPFAKLTIDGSLQEGSIYKNGTPWLSPPSQCVFGAPFYYSEESKMLYVCVYDSKDKTHTSGVLNLFVFNIDAVSDFDDIPAAEGKTFTGVNGLILICDDGTGYNIQTEEWIKI